MQNFFDINNIFFTIYGYPMSYLEFFGTLLNIWCVWLVAKKNIWNWPIGIIATVLFLVLFYQIRLYADFFEQIYFLITGFLGWWIWKGGTKEEGNVLKISICSKRERFFYLLVIVGMTLILGHLMKNIHLILPAYFPEPASWVYVDTFTTVVSFVATYLLIVKKVEAWILWIVVDVIGIWLYFVKEVRFISFLYLIFLVLATKGLIDWYKTWKKLPENIS